MDQEAYDALHNMYSAEKPDDGRDWCIWDEEDGMDPPLDEVMVPRGEGSFANVQSFERFDGREGLCVKIMKSRRDDAPSDFRNQSSSMFFNEFQALICTGEASVPGVVRLKARTYWRDSHALVLRDLGSLTLAGALRDGILNDEQKDDIVGQLIRTIVALSRSGVAHNNITPENIMLELDGSGDSASFRATLIDLGASTMLLDDGTSRPPMTGTQGYTDSQVTYTRAALRNGYSTPNGGYVKGIHTDMFSVAKVAMKMYGDLQFFSFGDEITSLIDPPRDEDLVELLTKSTSLRLDDRLNADELADSAFVKRWRERSKFAKEDGAAGGAMHEPKEDGAAGGAMHEPEQIPDQVLQEEQVQGDDASSDEAVDAHVPGAPGHGSSAEGDGSGGSAFDMASPAGAAAQVAADDGVGGGKGAGLKGVTDEHDPGASRTTRTRASDSDSTSARPRPRTAALTFAGTRSSSSSGSSGSSGGKRVIGGSAQSMAPAGAAAVTAAAGAEAGETAAAQAASAGMEAAAAAAAAGDDAVPTAAGGAASTARLGKRRRESEEDDGLQRSPRPQRHGGGGGSGVGANIVGATGEPVVPVPVPASVKRAVRTTTKNKTAESLRAEAIREAAGTGPQTRTKTKEKRKRVAEATVAGGSAPSKRPRKGAVAGPKTDNMTIEKRKRGAGATAAGGGAPSERPRQAQGKGPGTRRTTAETRKRAAGATAAGVGAPSKRSRRP